MKTMTREEWSRAKRAGHTLGAPTKGTAKVLHMDESGATVLSSVTVEG